MGRCFSPDDHGLIAIRRESALRRWVRLYWIDAEASESEARDGYYATIDAALERIREVA